jgi:hypothetical protein
MNISTGKQVNRPVAPQQSSVSAQPSTLSSYTVELPSKGRLYGGKSSVELTFFTLADVKRIYDISQGIKSDSLEKLVASKVHDYNLFDLAESDYWYLLYWLRINSFTSHPLEIEWTCTQAGCGTKNISKISKDSLNQVEINEEYSEPATLDLPDFGTIEVRLPRVKDDKEVGIVMDHLHGKLATEGDEWFCKRAAMWVDSRPLVDRYKELRAKFTPDDVFVLDGFQKDYSFGITEYLKVTCFSCQEVSQRYFRISLSSFIPSMETAGLARARVRFSKVSEPAVSVPGSDGL